MPDHLSLEVAHVVRVRAGQAEPLGKLDPVPGCACPRCVLLAMRDLGDLELGVVDVLLGNVLPALAKRLPIERPALAERFRAEWAESAFLVLPSASLLAELAARMPGARKAPRPVRDDREPLPIEAARRAPILDLCEELGIELKRAGKSYRGPCPFHDSTSGTSFTVSPSKGVYHCFGCGAGGDVIDLLRRVRDVPFPAAVRELASTTTQTMEMTP